MACHSGRFQKAGLTVLRDPFRLALSILRRWASPCANVPPKRGQIDATLHGELGTTLSWTAIRNGEKGTQTKTPAACATGVSVSVVAGTCNHPKLLFEAAAYGGYPA